tara:strand:+ start:356 stop:655 length:300 start_codon:yes stop_codon:yes gene_type:complete
MKKIDKKTQPGLVALKEEAPGAVANMGYMKKGGHAKKMMGGGMMGYKDGGDVKVDEVIKMPVEIEVPGMMGGGMAYKDGGDVEVVKQGHKGYSKAVKYK